MPSDDDGKDGLPPGEDETTPEKTAEVIRLEDFRKAAEERQQAAEEA